MLQNPLIKPEPTQLLIMDNFRYQHLLPHKHQPWTCRRIGVARIVLISTARDDASLKT